MNQDIGELRRPGGVLPKTGGPRATAESSQVTTCMSLTRPIFCVLCSSRHQ